MTPPASMTPAPSRCWSPHTSLHSDWVIPAGKPTSLPLQKTLSAFSQLPKGFSTALSAPSSGMWRLLLVQSCDPESFCSSIYQAASELILQNVLVSLLLVDQISKYMCLHGLYVSNGEVFLRHFRKILRPYELIASQVSFSPGREQKA